MLYRIAVWLRMGRFLSRCGAEPPWRLSDAEVCCMPAPHERSTEGWHADGTGYIWNATQWRWMGPVVDLAEEYRDHPARTPNGFEEWID